MKAVVLQCKGLIEIKDVQEQAAVGAHEVRVAIKACGICGSDVHYYTHGRIGQYVVEQPMILGHEAQAKSSRSALRCKI